MASFNKVILLGNLTRDPEVRYTPKGSAVCDLGIAVNRVYTTDSGEKREEVTYVDVVLWARLAEIAGEYLKKGRPVFIEGRLQLDTWDDKQSGQKRSKLRVIGETMQLLGGRPPGVGVGATVITQGSPSYPKPLREIHAPPIVLYVWGEIQERDHHALGIIGARRTTHYGSECAKKLAYQLAYAGLTVISGLARGIDTAAHQGALAAKGRTIAVIGSGLSKLYPPENAALADKIRAGNGAIVSEFSMAIEPDRQTFPMRNRIISGWSHGILVVEAGLNSGALITSAQALEQGRAVYAVPGHINAPSAIGSNRLIQQGAKLVMDANDILEDLEVLLPEA